MDTCFVTAKLTAKKGMEAQLEAEVVKNIPNVRAEKVTAQPEFIAEWSAYCHEGFSDTDSPFS